jgi:hypothetical protein
LLQDLPSESEQDIASPVETVQADKCEPHGNPGSDTVSSTAQGQTRQSSARQSHAPTACYFRTQDNFPVFPPELLAKLLKFFQIYPTNK